MAFRSHSRVILAVLIVSLVRADPARAQDVQAFTPQDALNVKGAFVEDVTDDGRWIALTERTRGSRLGVDHLRYGDPTYITPGSEALFVLDTETGERQAIEPGQVEVRGMTWSPDGQRLAFLQVEGDRYHLEIWDRTTGSVRRIDPDTDLEIAGSAPEWRPDGSAVVLELRPDGWREEARSAFLEMTEGPVIVQDSRNPFLAWDRVRNLGGVMIPALVEVPSGRVRELLPAGSYGSVEQSEDGRWMSFLTDLPVKTVYEGGGGTEWGLLRLEVASGDTTRLVEPSTDRIRASWNHAGDAYAYAEGGDVFVRSIEADSARRVTPEERGPVSETDTAKVRYSVMRWRPDGGALLVESQQGWHLVDTSTGDMRLLLAAEEDEHGEPAGPRRSVVGWSPDGRWIYMSTSARDHWERGLARLDVESGEEGGPSPVEQLVADANLYSGWRLSEDGSRILFDMSDGDHPGDLYVADARLDERRRLTEANPWLAERSLTRSELVEYLDVDGNRQFGILYYPVDYEPGRRYPLVAEIYEDFFDNGFNESMNLLANRGWFGFRPSVEFEEGYPGEAWLKGVTAGINTLIDRGLVDGDRLGVQGTSYGGYATNLLITQTDRFAAAINVSGKVDIISFLGDSPKITTRNYRAAESGQDRIGATLWEQPQKYIAHSAVMFADRIDTPLLLMTGEGDWNVPYTNEREMYYALRRLGKEVVWVHYMHAGHGAGRAGTVSDFLDYWNRIFDWYQEHFDKVGTEAEGPVTEGVDGGR